MDENNNRMEEYKTYYATRAKRYEGKENWKNTYNAEKKLCDFISSLSSFDGEDTKNQVVNLTFESAKASFKDQYLMELKYYEKEQEFVKAAGAKRILDSIDKYSNVSDLTSFVQEETNKIVIENTSDEAHRECFQGCINYFINYERKMLWDGPSKYKPENPKNELIKEVREKLDMVRNNTIKFDPNWKLDPSKNLEYRHIRKLAYFKDENIQEFFKLFLEVINK